MRPCAPETCHIPFKTRQIVRSSAKRKRLDEGSVIFLSPTWSAPRSHPPRLPLDFYVLVGWERAHPHIRDRVLGDARADAHEGAEVNDRRIHHTVDGELLDLVKQRLAFGPVRLARL